MQELLDAPDILNQVISVIQASRVTSNISFRPSTQLRLDLVAVLLKIGLRLDVSRKGITASGTSLPDIDGSSIEEWLAVFTVDIVCQRGVLRFHLVAPDERWIAPLVGATVVAMENLWQQVRPVLTQHDMSFAVARPHIEIAGDIEFLPDALLERVQTASRKLPVRFRSSRTSANLACQGLRICCLFRYRKSGWPKPSTRRLSEGYD